MNAAKIMNEKCNACFMFLVKHLELCNLVPIVETIKFTVTVVW